MRLKVTIRNIAKSPHELRVTVTGRKRAAFVKKVAPGRPKASWDVWMDDVGSFLRDFDRAAHDLAAESGEYVDLKVDAVFMISGEPDEDET